MKFKHSDMLVYIAIGDAYCLATEYIKLPKYKKLQYDALELKTYLKHPTHNNNAGTYSDDCQMSIGVAEVLIDGPPYTKLSFANASTGSKFFPKPYNSVITFKYSLKVVLHSFPPPI